MTKAAYQYAIVRFAPYVETGEFANVGIVMIGTRGQYFDFMLETKRRKRITDFFPEMDARVFRHSMQNLKEELEWLQLEMKRSTSKGAIAESATHLFKELTRPREIVLQFSNPRFVLGKEPKETLKDLFDYYVHRNFVTREYNEARLEKSLRKWLSQESLADRFHPAELGDDIYKVNFKFVEDVAGKPEKVIKPLDLDKENPSKILDHGGAWLFKLNQLKDRGALPKAVMLSVAAPTAEDKRLEAYDDIVGRLKHTGVAIARHTDRSQIIEFARS